MYLVTESQVLSCISDDKCREMLELIREGQSFSISNLQLTRKQFYSRLHALIIYNLVSKANGRYRLTSFGKVVFDWHLVLMHAISDEYLEAKGTRCSRFFSHTGLRTHQDHGCSGKR